MPNNTFLLRSDNPHLRSRNDIDITNMKNEHVINLQFWIPTTNLSILSPQYCKYVTICQLIPLGITWISPFLMAVILTLWWKNCLSLSTMKGVYLCEQCSLYVKDGKYINAIVLNAKVTWTPIKLIYLNSHKK